MSWLDGLHTIFKATVEQPLTSAGWTRKGGSWSGKVRGRVETVGVQWGRGQRSDSAAVWVRVGGVQIWHVSDEAQARAFIDNGDDRFADAVLGPIGVLEEYRRQLALLVGDEADDAVCMNPRSTGQAADDRLLKVLQGASPYRWSDPEAVRAAMAARLAPLLGQAKG